jgi:adenine-specific DNA-methyltransferase
MSKSYINNLYRQGRSLEKKKSQQDRKKKGVFYTPKEIVDYMVNNLLSSMDVRRNPYIRILDISCGAGYFVLKCFEALKKLFEENYEAILQSHPELQGIMTYDTLGQFIVEHNIYGADIDPEAVCLVGEALQRAAGGGCRSNMICGDSLLDSIGFQEHNSFWREGFDCIIGNPPYIGHKNLGTEYKRALYKHYGQVYRDKSDISYCFFYRAMEQLKDGGALSFITSRYFMEGPSAEGLREYLAAYDIQEIVEFGDQKIFSDAGVSVCILHIAKKPPSSPLQVRVIENKEQLYESKAFPIDRGLLKREGWLLLEPQRLEVFRLVEAQGTHLVEELFQSYQGIITGCDKAFVLQPEEAEERNIEKSLLQPWIKNSNVEKFYIKPANKLLIYADLIQEEAAYPQALSFIGRYREKLLLRRECRKGLRSWYHLQWGRKREIFEGEKIVYPYKASCNRFAVDRQGHYCSADVYSLVLKEEYKESFSLDYMAALLNSTLLTFYFKAIAKKISPTLYDYYPNKVLKIKLKLDVIGGKIEDLVKELHNTREEAERACILETIDREVYKIYGLREDQIEIIKKWAGE